MTTACSTQDLTTANDIGIGCARHWESTIWLACEWWKDKKDDDWTSHSLTAVHWNHHSFRAARWAHHSFRADDWAPRSSRAIHWNHHAFRAAHWNHLTRRAVRGTAHPLRAVYFAPPSFRAVHRGLHSLRVVHCDPCSWLRAILGRENWKDSWLYSLKSCSLPPMCPLFFYFPTQSMYVLLMTMHTYQYAQCYY